MLFSQGIRRRKQQLRKFGVILIIPTIIVLAYLIIKTSRHYLIKEKDNTISPFGFLPKFYIPAKYGSNATLRTLTQIAPLQGGSKPIRSNKCPIVLVIILCNDGSAHSVFVQPSKKKAGGKNVPGKGKLKEKVDKEIPARSFERQVNQTIVLIKSLAIQQTLPTMLNKTSEKDVSCVELLVLSDREENFDIVETAIRKQNWAQEFLRAVQLKFVPVSYPHGASWMRKLFRPCATLRLFLADLLSDYDSVIYLDTDIIFLRNPEDLWSLFEDFSSEKVLSAMAPCLNHYGTQGNQVPFYGTSGLNAGIMLMNLTRIRNTGWTKRILEVTRAFQHHIVLADQDILNIYFHYHPEEIHELTCDWNFRPFQCRKGNYCQDLALGQGISALHGNALSFTSEGPEPLFHAVFSLFQNLSLQQTNSDHLRTLCQKIDTRLKKIQQRSRSDCSTFGAFNVLLLNRMNALLQSSV